MIRTLLLPVLTAWLFLPAYADLIVPVAGSTSGAFSNPTGGSSVAANKWTYGNSETGYVLFTGAGFSGNTPSYFEFGQIDLHNTSNGGNGLFTANLGLTVSFTTPSGNLVNFTDGFQLTANSGNGGTDSLNLILDSPLPGDKTFTVGTDTYTVKYLGFFNSSSEHTTAVTSLSVPNSPGGEASAYLWGNITAVAPPNVPEPASIVLMGTLLLGVSGLLKRRLA
jgi:hypothetical protein